MAFDSAAKPINHNTLPTVTPPTSSLAEAFRTSPMQSNSPLSPPTRTSSFPSPRDQSSHPTSNQKPSSPSSNGTPPALHLNPRSCVICRKRKVKCDKRHPCFNCHKAGIECTFPGPGRAPRRNKKPPDMELLERLRRLEGVVKSMGKGIDGEDLPEGSESADLPREAREKTGSISSPSPTAGFTISGDGIGETPFKKANLDKDFGHLVVSEGRSRYVSNSFWASLTEEIAEMRDILDDPSDEEYDHSSPETDPTATANHQSFVFGYSSTMTSLRILHPPVKMIMKYWEVYVQNIDPLVKILHVPSAEKLLREAIDNIDHIARPTEAIMFAVYFSVVISLTAEECRDRLQQDKEIALKRYRFGVEQALAKTDFLGTQELVVLQAFTLFLVCVRRYDDTRFVWSLTGVAIRSATSLGIHRDGEQFGLDPFTTELRRRLWWQICTLDVRASEDQGTEPSIVDAAFDTKLPRNINDTDIWPGMTGIPEERVGFTDMSFVLVRYEIGYTIRKLSYKPPGALFSSNDDFATLADKEQKIEDLRMYLQEKYLKYCDLQVPLQWVSYNVAQLILSKMYMMIMHPLNRAPAGAKISKARKDRLFHTSIDVVRRSRILERQHQTFRWGWLFRTYIQWHGVAYILAELCVRAKGPDVDLAWEVIDEVFDEWGGVVSATKKGMLWKPMRKLMTKARAARKAALEQEAEKRSMFPSDGTLGMSPVQPTNGVPNGILQNSMQQSLNNATGLMMPITTSTCAVDPMARQPMPMQQPLQGVPLLGQLGSDVLRLAPGVEQQPSAQSHPQGLWNYDGQASMMDTPLMGSDSNPDESMNWEGWDDMVRDFQMDTSQGQGFDTNQVITGPMGDWW